MKKLLLSICALMLAGMIHAQYALSINGEFTLEKDTAITITDYEDFDGEVEMELNGMIISSSVVYVDITRPSGAQDELCAGACYEGDGNTQQTMTFDLSMSIYAGQPVRLFAHYYPTERGVATYTYTFRSGTQSACLTVNYAYQAESAVDMVTAPVRSRKVIRDGQVLIVRDGVEYSVLGSKL